MDASLHASLHASLLGRTGHIACKCPRREAVVDLQHLDCCFYCVTLRGLVVQQCKVGESRRLSLLNLRWTRANPLAKRRTLIFSSICTAQALMPSGATIIEVPYGFAVCEFRYPRA